MNIIPFYHSGSVFNRNFNIYDMNMYKHVCVCVCMVLVLAQEQTKMTKAKFIIGLYVFYCDIHVFNDLHSIWLYMVVLVWLQSNV